MTDEIDAENLARLARLDPKLLYPLKHRGEESQAHMAIVRSREALVGCRTQLAAQVANLVHLLGGRRPLRRLQRLLSSPKRSISFYAPSHRAVGSLKVRMEA